MPPMKKLSEGTECDTESSKIRNQVKKNIRDIFNNTKDKPVTEKVKIQTMFKSVVLGG